ncbi:MAG TPA: hypothetical protein VMB47_01925 [Candidatus Aquilonibacter sp.]|nr:hypothetical protein [Candidatus Aquilonibacter sp.]
MSALTIWWIGICLESVVIAQGIRAKVFTKYPVFFAYLAFVLASEVSRYAIYERVRPLYRGWWWTTEFIGVLLGYLLIMNVLEKVLTAYPGARKFARNIGMFIFAGIVLFTSAEWLFQRQISPALTSIEVGRNLRSAEALLLSALLLVIAYYGVRIGRNMTGIIAGYGMYIALEVIMYACRALFGQSFQSSFSRVRSYSYLVALVVWLAALWSYSPVVQPEPPLQLESDYQAFADSTRERIDAMRSYLGRPGKR